MKNCKTLTLKQGEYWFSGIIDDTIRMPYTEKSEVLSCASFHPYFTGVSSDERGAKTVLQGLQTPYGVAATDFDRGHFQWGYPNGWAPLHYVAAVALKNCGLTEDAKIVARAYCDTVESCFEKSGRLFEKYNMQTGTSDTLDEYELPHMLGWSAGVFLALLHDFIS